MIVQLDDLHEATVGRLAGNLQAALVVRSGMYVISKKVDAVLPVGLQAVDKLYSKVVGLTPADLLTVDNLHNNLNGLREKSKGIYAALPGVKDVHVRIVWEPRWTRDRLSESAKRELGMA